MTFNVLFWILLIALSIGLAAVLSLTLFVRSNYTMALKQISSGKPKEALDLLMRVVGWQQKHVPSLWQVALLHLSMDKSDAAVKDLTRIVSIMDVEPDKASAAARWEVTEAQVLSKLAWTLSKLNKRAEAISYFQRLIEHEPKNKEARFELARLLYMIRDYDRCIPMLESVIQIDPVHTEAYETMSNALSAKGDHRRAADMLAKRLANDRKDANLWIRLANLYRTAQDNAKQSEAWKVVTEITPDQDPNHVSAVVQLGKIAYLAGKYEDAIDQLKTASDLCSVEDTRTLKSVKYYTGRAYLELGRKADARMAFSQVYDMDRAYKDIRDLLRESYELLSDDDLVEELGRMRVDEFSSLASSIVKHMGYKPVSVETVNGMDTKIDARLEETGKDRFCLLYFQRADNIDVGELAIRTFIIECDEKHIEYPAYFTTGGFSFEAQLKAKDHRLKLMPKREFCEIIRRVRTTV